MKVSKGIHGFGVLFFVTGSISGGSLCWWMNRKCAGLYVIRFLGLSGCIVS